MTEIQGLPVEQGSDAVVLTAAHLFVMEAMGVTGGEWSKGADGLEHRTLHLNVRILENLKGTLPPRAGDQFSVDVPQKREDALTVSDYHGFWSHTVVERGKKYLVVSNGAGDAPALLRDPGIVAVLDVALVDDVKLAIEAEQRFGAALRGENKGREEAALQLLALAREHRQTVGQLFSQYVWVRVAPVYLARGTRIEAEVLRLIAAPDASLALRDALIFGAYNAVMAPEPSEVQATVLRALLQVLLQPEAAPLFDRMLQVAIYNLAFRMERPAQAAGEIVTSEAERARMSQVAARYPSARAQAVAQWLVR